MSEADGRIRKHTLAQVEQPKFEEEKQKALDLVKMCESGHSLRRVKRKLRRAKHISIFDKNMNYYSRFLYNLLPDKVKNVEISDILEVRPGYRTDIFMKASRKEKFRTAAPEDVCFSVILTHTKFLRKSIDFVAPSKEVRDTWINALTFLVNAEKAQRAQFNEKQWLLKQFHRCDLNRNGILSFDEIWELLNELNLELSKDYAKSVFKKADVIKKDGCLNEEEFLKFFEILTERPDLLNVLRMNNANGVESWTVKDLQKFLTEVQQFPDITEEKAKSILKTFEEVQENGEHGEVMGVVGARRLLQSRWGHILKPGHEGIYQDMDQPLPHYYCNTSHNTYLMAGQLAGDATVEGYIYALLKGARLLELDIYHDDEEGLLIYHGFTLVKPLHLKHALGAIKRRAFEVSPYPVILTIENHCDADSQKTMAETFIEILGDQLYIPPPNADDLPFPSPNELKKKFIIRGKRGVFAKQEEEKEDDEEKNKMAKAEALPKVKSVADATLSSLIALPSVKVEPETLHEACKKHPPNSSPSLTENKAIALCEDHAQLVKYTSEHFVKVFPKGLRQDSSNLEPMSLWLQGIQGVALNFQTTGESVDLNVGKFRVNGGCGYILKPKELLEGKDLKQLTKPKLRIGIGIISAQYLPKPNTGRDIIDPYVRVQIFGVPQDEWNAKTKTIRDNGFNPVWNKTFYRELVCPDAAMLRFVVMDYDSTFSSDFVGECSIPVRSIRAGYSSIRLHTGYAHTVDASATLFVCIEIEELEDEF
ncbi:unnamed protein product, partial [Mesorhabditis belari]|uniref:Phosphoinositide phospholipase C n=1 Tax=Mesorhabditis belari TaxID=2138241 RepID=A0AAF3FLP2_9BILA